MPQDIIYNKGGVFRACLSGTPSLPVTACGAEKPQIIWMCSHIALFVSPPLHADLLLILFWEGTWCPYITARVYSNHLQKKWVQQRIDTLFKAAVYMSLYEKHPAF